MYIYIYTHIHILKVYKVVVVAIGYENLLTGTQNAENLKHRTTQAYTDFACNLGNTLKPNPRWLS